ncbi:MAG: hypothetical protein QM485_06900, partial [Flavobacteriaceae bacterium]
MKSLIVFLVLALLICSTLQGQIKIGDNPQNIDPSSVLELESTSRVLVITRVTDQEMNAIVPSHGALIYNTETLCIHYFNGSQWINICDSLGLSFSADPLVNDQDGLSTIVITQTGDNYNFEVAPNSIRSAQIVDGGINGVDIQNNSIGQNKLADDSVGRGELQDNTITDSEIDYNEVTLSDFTNDAGFITGLTIVSVAAGNAITDNGGAFFDDSALQTDIDQNTVAIAADGDTDNTNERITALALDGTELVITEPNNERRIDLGIFNNTGSDDQQLTLEPGNRLTLENGGTAIDLTSFLNTNEQQLSISGNRITLTAGGFVDLPPSAVEVDGVIGNEIINATDLTLIRSGAGTAVSPFTIDVNVGGIGNTELANNAVNSVKIANATILAEDLNQMSATPGQVLKWNGTIWEPEADNGGTAYTPGTGLSLSGTNQFSVNDLSGDVAGPTTATVIADNVIRTNHILNATITSADIATATIQAGNLAVGGANQILQTNATGTNVNWVDLVGSGSTEEADMTTITGDGTNADPFKIEPGPNGQYLSTTAGAVVWANLPGGTGGTVEVDGITIEGNGVSPNQLQIRDGGITAVKLANMGATNNQVLKWDGTTWVPAADVGGTTYIAGTGLTLAGGTTFSVDDLAGDVTGQPGTTVIADNAINSAK